VGRGRPDAPNDALPATTYFATSAAIEADGIAGEACQESGQGCSAAPSLAAASQIERATRSTTTTTAFHSLAGPVSAAATTGPAPCP